MAIRPRQLAHGCRELRVTGPIVGPADAEELSGELQQPLDSHEHVLINLLGCPRLDDAAAAVLCEREQEFGDADLDFKVFAARPAVLNKLRAIDMR